MSKYLEGKFGRARTPTIQLGIDPDAVADAVIGTFHQPSYKPPVAPSVALELHELVRQPEVEMVQISHILSRDPMLAARVLRVAQSPVFGGVSGRVTSLEEATIRVGLRQLADLFLEIALSVRVFRAPGFDAPMEDLLDHSVRVARTARALAPDVGLDPDHAFLFGLLHDIGYAAALIVVADGQAIGAFSKMPFDQVRLAIDSVHTQASGVIARLWGLPTDLARAVENHHRWVLGTELYREGALLSVIESAASPKHETVSDPALVAHASEALGLSAERIASAWGESSRPRERTLRKAR